MEEANLHGFVANCLGICHCMVSVTLSGISGTVNGASSQRWRCLPRTDGKTPRDCSLKKKKNQKLPCTLFTWFWLEWISGNKTEWAPLHLSGVGANWNERSSDSLLFAVSPPSVTCTQRFLPDNGCCYHIQIRYYPPWIFFTFLSKA